jgi:hypothetical protein
MALFYHQRWPGALTSDICDSAAIVKLVHPEPESHELRLWLAERVSLPRFTSVLAEVEGVPRDDPARSVQFAERSAGTR